MYDHHNKTCSMPVRSRRFRVDSADLEVPATAWPTVVVFLAALGVWAAPAVLQWQYAVESWWTLLPSTAAIFVLFTPMHDAAHRAVSQRYRWLNEAVGWVCALIYCSSFLAFRYIHFQHHKFTNDPKRDPDYWSGSGPTLLKPLRWLAQEFHYHIPYVKAARAGLRPWQEAWLAYAVVLLLLAIIVGLSVMGYWREVLRLWFVPQHVASTLLAYTFDYIPHRPHTVRRSEDIYRCTSKIDGVLSTRGVDLSLLLLYQTYHNVHHLYPRIPFYRYIVIWQKYRDELIKHGTPVVPAYSSTAPWI